MISIIKQKVKEKWGKSMRIVKQQSFQQSENKKGNNLMAIPFSIICLFYCYTNINIGFSMYDLNVFKNSEPVTPSTTLWSHESVTFITFPGTT